MNGGAMRQTVSLLAQVGFQWPNLYPNQIKPYVSVWRNPENQS